MIVERRSIVDAPSERVWSRVVTPEGINDELRPWMTMSMPRGKESLSVDDIPVGSPVGRCWLRLFGVLPFDYDELMIAELWPGRGFHEESTMLSMRLWPRPVSYVACEPVPHVEQFRSPHAVPIFGWRIDLFPGAATPLRASGTPP